MPDLEDSIRDALQSRSDSTVVVETSLRDRPRRSFAPLLAAAVVLLLALATAAVVTHRGDDSKERSANGGAGFVGFAWRLVSVHDKEGTVRAQQAWNTRLYFTPDGEVAASDTVNGLSGRYHRTGSGYTVTDSASTLVAYAGNANDRKRVMAAITSTFYTTNGDTQEPHASVRASVDGNALTLTTPDAELTYEQTGVQQNDPSPSSTRGPSSIFAAVIGYRWRVTQVHDARGTFDVPASKGARLEFPTATTIQGSNSVNFLLGRMQQSGPGFTTTDFGGTYALPAAGDRLAAAVDAVFRVPGHASNSVHSKVNLLALAGNELMLNVGTVSLTLTRDGKA